MAALIAAQRDGHGIPCAVACRALGVSRSWLYKWWRGGGSAWRARRARLKGEVRRLFEAHRGKRGSPMITADLHDLGWRVSKNTVAAVMAGLGLAARPKKRRKGTTRPGKGRWRAPDLVQRDFPAAGINQKWYGDGTDIDTDEGKLHLDSVLDVGSRRVLGFALGEHHDADLAYGAMAVAVRGGAVPGVMKYGQAPPAPPRARRVRRPVPGAQRTPGTEGELAFDSHVRDTRSCESTTGRGSQGVAWSSPVGPGGGVEGWSGEGLGRLAPYF